MTRRPRMVVCTRCGYHGGPADQRPTALWGVLLLFFWVVPGVLYFVWWMQAAKLRCPSCTSDSVIPDTSPIAQEFLARHQR